MGRGGLWAREMCQGSPLKVGQRICQADKNMSSLFGGKGGGGGAEPKSPALEDQACLCVQVCVCVLIFLHIEAWNNVEQQFVLKPADPP